MQESMLCTRALLVLAQLSVAACFAPTATLHTVVPPSHTVVPPSRAIVVASFIDDFVKKASDAIGSNEKGFGLGYSKDERRARASHILFSFEDYPEDAEVSGEKMAEALKAKILDPANEEFTFEFVATKFSSCSTGSAGGDMGSFQRGDMVAEIDKAVFDVRDDVPIGRLQGPIKTVRTRLTRRDSNPRPLSLRHFACLSA